MLSFRVEHTLSHAVPLLPVASVGTRVTEETGTDKQAHWLGKDGNSCSPFSFSSVHFCSFSSPPLYPESQNAQHGVSPPQSSSLC